MNRNDREKVREMMRDVANLQHKLACLYNELDEMATEVEAYVMKKTTQRSPEWRGGANC